MSLPQASEVSDQTLDIKDRHKRLYEQFRADEEEIGKNPPRREEFRGEFEELLGRFRQLAQELRLEEDFQWLTSAAREWEEAHFRVFREPRNLRAEIGISVPPPHLEPAFQPVTDEDVRAYLKSKANDVAQARKLTQLFWRWAELKSHPERIHAEIHSKNEEMDEDWYWANVFFAARVLEGEIRFPYRIGPELYGLLEKVWLEDVKRLKAYLLWERDGCHWQPDGGAKYFFQAADSLRETALSTRLKASLNSFSRAETYVEQSYLSEGAINPLRDSSAHDLIARKADRIWLKGPRRRTAEADWADAQRYVRGFYDHILPAVRQADAAHIAGVAEALCSAHRGKMPCDIVNCLEAALVIYYVDPARLRSACGSEVHLLF